MTKDKITVTLEFSGDINTMTIKERVRAYDEYFRALMSECGDFGLLDCEKITTKGSRTEA